MTTPRRRKANRAALTPRQREVIELAMQGKTDRETAEALGTTVNTIRSHRGSVLRRMNAHTMVEAAVKYERERAETEARELLRQHILREVSA